VYRSMAESWQELGERSREVSHLVSTEGRPKQALFRALAVLRQLGL
jgi:hypothetical protein